MCYKKINFLKIFRARLNNKIFNRQTFLSLFVQDWAQQTRITTAKTRSGVETYQNKGLNIEAYKAFLSWTLWLDRYGSISVIPSFHSFYLSIILKEEWEDSVKLIYIPKNVLH